jgi:2'-5' RNA ligase
MQILSAAPSLCSIVQRMHLQFPLRSAFVAIPLTGDAKVRFQAYHDALKPFEEFLRLQSPETPHLTLTFWRIMMEIEYYQVLGACENIARQSETFELPVRGAETFGNKGIDRVLYAKPVFSPELAVLKKRCPWPNPPDEPFTPHITLARISHPQKFTIHKKKVMKALEGLDFTLRVDRITLYGDIGGTKQAPVKEWVFPGN